MKFTTRKILAVTAAVLSCTLACAADETDAPLGDSAAEETGSSVEFLTEELNDLRVTTTLMSEGAVVELVDTTADVVVATLDWDGHSSTLELDLDDSVTSIELDSPPQVSDLNAILLAQWHGAKDHQVDQADAIPVEGATDLTVSIDPVAASFQCSGKWVNVSIPFNEPYAGCVTHDRCNTYCGQCGRHFGFTWSCSIENDAYNSKCFCYNQDGS